MASVGHHKVGRMKKQRIRLGILFFPYVVGGVEHFIFRLLSRLNSMTFTSLLLFEKAGPASQFFYKHGFNVSILSGRKYEVVSSARRWLNRYSIDLMMTTCYQSFAAEACASSQVPHIWRCGGTVQASATRPVSESPKDLLTLMDLLSDKIVVNSKSVAEQFSDLPENKLIFIPNGIGLKPSALTSLLNLRQRFFWSPHDRVVAMIGNLAPVKRHADFINAAARIHKQYANTRFVIFSNSYAGPVRKILELYEKHLQQLVRKKGLNNKLVFVKGLDDLSGVFREIDLVVHTCPYESFPNAVLEAMAAGKPVIAVRSGGSKELIRHGETGVLVPPFQPDQLAKTIKFFLDRPKSAGALGQGARAFVKRRYDIRQIARRYEKLFEGVLRCARSSHQDL